MISADPPRWWERRWVLVLVVLLSAMPLLYPQVPPLVDLPGHMGRYRVQIDVDSSPWLHNFYGFDWAAIGNLGVDLLIVPLAPLVGLELAVKLVVLAIPPLTVAGFLLVAREVHGRVPPTTFFALPFALGYPFLYGFANFALSMALAFIGFALWLRLGRLGRTRTRALLFVPISIIVFFAHTYGWGALGLLCFSGEAVRLHDRGKRWFRAGIEAALHASVMALPLIFMIAWRADSESVTSGWFAWNYKWEWIYSALRDRWQVYDIGSVAVAAAVALYAVFSRKLAFSRNLAFSALVLIAAFVLIPRVVFSSAYADMRLVPYMMATGLLAIRFKGDMAGKTVVVLLIAGLTFFGVRLVGTTASLMIAAEQQRAMLKALEHVPHGARVVSLVGRPCGNAWAPPRDVHLGAMVMVRRHGFSNDQWTIEGTNLLTVRHDAGVYSADPSQIVRPAGCGKFWTVETALHYLPRSKFDYLWAIHLPPFDERALDGMTLVWEGPRSSLYRIGTAAAGPQQATPRRASAPAR